MLILHQNLCHRKKVCNPNMFWRASERVWGCTNSIWLVSLSPRHQWKSVDLVMYCRILTYKRFFQLSFIFRQTFVLKVSQLCPWGLRRSDEFPSHKNVMVEIDRGIHRYATMAWWPCATPPSNILPALPYPLSEVSYRSGSRDTPKCAQEQQKLVSGSRPTEVSWFLEFQ